MRALFNLFTRTSNIPRAVNMAEIAISVKITNTTMSQQLKSFLYSVTGNDIYTIAAEHAGIVTANGTNY